MIINSINTGIPNALPNFVSGNMKIITEHNLRRATNIAPYAFYNQTQLDTITIPTTVTRIGTNAFGNSGLNSLILQGDTVKTLSNINAFSGTTFAELKINKAPLTQYKGTNNTTIFGSSTTNWGEANWNSYDATPLKSKLIDGIISSGTLSKDTIEFWYTVVTTGWCYIYFKLPRKMLIREVRAWFTDRSQVTTGTVSRGFPRETAYNVYVCNGADNVMDASITTKLPNLTVNSNHSYGAAYKEYINKGQAYGDYVCLEMQAANPIYVFGLAEVEIYGLEAEDIPENFGIFIDSSNTSLVEQYKTATNWSYYADFIKPISEYNGKK